MIHSKWRIENENNGFNGFKDFKDLKDLKDNFFFEHNFFHHPIATKAIVLTFLLFNRIQPLLRFTLLF